MAGFLKDAHATKSGLHSASPEGMVHRFNLMNNWKRFEEDVHVWMVRFSKEARSRYWGINNIKPPDLGRIINMTQVLTHSLSQKHLPSQVQAVLQAARPVNGAPTAAQAVLHHSVMRAALSQALLHLRCRLCDLSACPGWCRSSGKLCLVHRQRPCSPA